MTDTKNKKTGNGIVIDAALGVAFGAAFGAATEDISMSIAVGLAIGTTLGAIFDFIKKRIELQSISRIATNSYQRI
ncbi:MAG: hypothetical protein AAF149_22460 [Bacteroidota bacterium]